MNQSIQFLLNLALDASAIPDCFTHPGQDTIPGMKKEAWYRFPREDPSLKKVISHFKQLSCEPLEVRLLLKEWKKLEFKDGVMYRKFLDHGVEV